MGDTVFTLTLASIFYPVIILRVPIGGVVSVALSVWDQIRVIAPRLPIDTLNSTPHGGGMSTPHGGGMSTDSMG